MNAHFAIGNFIRDALAGQVIRVTGGDTPRRSYLYAADLTIWLWTVLLRGASGRAYNTGSANALSMGLLAAAVAAAVPGSKVEPSDLPLIGRGDLNYVPSVRRAETELGLAEYISLPAAIKKTIKWHEARRSLLEHG